MGWGEGECREEARRKEQFFRRREREESIARKELHYQQLITREQKAKGLLKAAKEDIEDWMEVKGEDSRSLAVVKEINSFLKSI